MADVNPICCYRGSTVDLSFPLPAVSKHYFLYFDLAGGALDTSTAQPESDALLMYEVGL